MLAFEHYCHNCDYYYYYYYYYYDYYYYYYYYYYAYDYDYYCKNGSEDRLLDFFKSKAIGPRRTKNHPS